MKMLSALLGVLFLSSGLSSADEARPRKVALLVGVNKYDRRGFEPLKYAERDMEELAKVLRKAGFEVRELLGKDATKENLDRALEEMLNPAKKSLVLTQRDTVLLALAGHGQQFEVEQDGKKKEVPFYCPCDAVNGEPQTLLNLAQVLQKLDKKGGKFNLLLVDACRTDPKAGRNVDGNKVELPLGMAVMFSCSRGEQAFETRDAGGGHGVFFHFVLEGLRGKAKDSRGSVTWDGLVAHVRRSVADYFKKQDNGEGARQLPHAVSNLNDIAELTQPGGGNLQEVWKRAEDFAAAKNWARAIAAYTEIIQGEDASSSAFAYYNRGLMKQYQGDHAGAIVDYTTALELQPKYAHAYINRGVAHHEKKAYKEALTDLTTAISLDSKSVAAFDHRANTYLTLKKYQEAIDDLTTAIRLDGKFSFAYMRRGLAHLLNNEDDAALEDFNQFMTLAPQHAYGPCYRGFVWEKKQEYKKALADYKKAIDLDRNFADAHSCLGNVYMATREYSNALLSYSNAIRINPNNPLYYTKRARAYEALRKVTEARKDLAMAKRLEMK